VRESIDIDEAQVQSPADLRDALVDHLAYLVEEIEALQTVVGSVPDQIKNERPAPDALTMKELYGAIAALDEEVRPGRIERVMEEGEPTLSPIDIEAEVREAGWNERELTTILDRVETARHQLVDRLDALPPEAWHRAATLEDERYTLFELVHRMTQEDLQRLRDLGYRLHGAHLSDRDEPLPT